MDLSLAVVWHFWLAVALAVPAVLLTLTIGILYVVKVEMPRYAKSNQPDQDEYEAIQARGE